MNSENAPKLKDYSGKRELLMMQFIMIAPCFFMKLELDNDAYWLIQAGRNLIQNGIPHVDPLTFHEDLHYVMQQWLTAGIYAFLYDSVGAIGILLFVLAIFIAIILILFQLCMLISNQNILVSYLITIFDVIVLFLFMTTRPYPISMLIFLIEIFVLEKYLHSKDRRWLIGIPVLSLILINFHGAIWPFFFIIMVPYVIDSFRFKIGFIQGEGYLKRDFLLAFGLAFFAGFINPYGWELMTYLFRSYGNANISAFVLEMKSPNFQAATGMYVFAILLIALLLLFISKPPRLKLRYGLLMLGTVFMALSSLRNLSLFAICGIPMLSYALRAYEPNLRSKQKKRPRLQQILLVIFVLIIVLSFPIRLYDSYPYHDTSVPTEAVDFISEQYCDEDIRLFTDYNWGGYVEFRGLKPFIDARAEVFLRTNNHKEDILDDLIALRTGELYYQKFIDKYRCDVLLIQKTELLEVYLSEDSNYTLVYEDQDAVVYERVID